MQRSLLLLSRSGEKGGNYYKNVNFSHLLDRSARRMNDFISNCNRFSLLRFEDPPFKTVINIIIYRVLVLDLSVIDNKKIFFLNISKMENVTSILTFS
jgi:hypothetical protein